MVAAFVAGDLSGAEQWKEGFVRDYAKVSPQFWTGNTGKLIRAAGAEVQVVALYLITNPSANMIGIYNLPLAYLANDTGCSLQGARKALLKLEEVHFAYYDAEAEVVFVPNMIKFQIGAFLVPADKRVKFIKKEIQQFRKTKFFSMFHSAYKDAFHLGEIEPLPSPLQAPTKPVDVDVAVDVDVDVKKDYARKASAYSSLFLDFWKIHPRGSKKEAFEEYKKTEKSGEGMEVILEILKNQVAERATTPMQGVFIPPLQDLNRWLKKRRWEDAPFLAVKVQPAPALPSSKVKAFTSCTVPGCGWVGKSIITGRCPEHAGMEDVGAAAEPVGDDKAEVAKVLAQIMSSLPKMPDGDEENVVDNAEET